MEHANNDRYRSLGAAILARAIMDLMGVGVSRLDRKIPGYTEEAKADAELWLRESPNHGITCQLILDVLDCDITGDTIADMALGGELDPDSFKKLASARRQ